MGGKNSGTHYKCSQAEIKSVIDKSVGFINQHWKSFSDDRKYDFAKHILGKMAPRSISLETDVPLADSIRDARKRIEVLDMIPIPKPSDN
jgi:hypothetical protein